MKRDPDKMRAWMERSRKLAAMQKKPKHKSAKVQAKWERAFNSEVFVQFVQAMPCLRCGRTPSVLHHEPPRSLGGTWETVVPLCNDCHTLGPGARHRAGVVTFWQRLGKDYRKETARVRRLWAQRCSDMDF